MIDGFALVIEVRRGATYRASMFEAIKPPEVDADRVAQQIYRTVMREYGAVGSKRS
jgi:hypothetical protein